MEFIFFTGVILILVIAIYLKYKEKFKYFSKRGAPYVEPSGPLGNTWRTVLFMENIVETLERIYRDNSGRGVYGIYHGTMPIFVISDPSLIGEVMVKEFSNFHDRGFSVNADLNPLENHLVNLEGSKWKTVRSKLSPTFTSGKLKGMLPLMKECVDSFMATIPDGKDRDMKRLFGRLTIHVIGSCAFGIDSDALRSENSQFISACDKLSNPGFSLFFRTSINFAYPRLAKLIGLRTWPEETNKFFFSIVQEGFAARKNNQIVRNDFLQILLELKEKGEIQKDDYYEEEDDHKHIVQEHPEEESGTIALDDSLLTAQAFVFFIAGYETTASCLGFLLYLLSKNQWAQEAARKELREVKEKHGSFTYQSLKELVYMEACIKETLRLYPPIGTLVRKCTKPSNIGGVEIEKGMMIFIPIASIHRDANYFPSPNEFRPERFLDEEPIPFTYMPFGAGPRVCIGERFAMMEIKSALVRVLDAYAAEPSPKMASAEPIKLQALAFVSTPKDGIHCILRKLKD